ncbi:acyltransferase [Ancylostoma duodenale]|uniref:Acyltransferase n=1 Tax=Ancylostoma duodenale TaxID=51022 RepID=A0A0C2G2B9_9BILA|nr:acyltransferase [Ancylostoma duodenale]
MERHSYLDILDVFRVIAIIWVMVNHTGSEGRVDILDRLPSAENFKNSVHNNPIFGALLGNSALGVEIFLVLSGLLAARSWQRKADQPFFKHYREFIIRRVLRLAPSIIFFVYIVAGPITKHFLPRFHSSMISACGVSGIASHLTFLGNWQSTPTCMGYLWYLGLDMQLYMIAPFVLHLLYKNFNMGKIVCALMIVASMFLRAAYCTAYGVCHKSDVDIPFIAYPGQDPKTLAGIYAGLWEMYARPYTKCGPFLLGVLLGTVTMSLKPRLDRATSRLIASAFFALCIGVIYAILPQYWYGDYLTLYNLYYTAAFRTVFSIGICGMILAFISRTESTSYPLVWSIMARLTCNAYLLHMPIIYLFNYSQYLQQAEGATELMVVVPFVAVLSFSAASVFYFFVEAPLGYVTSFWVERIERILAKV